MLCTQPRLITKSTFALILLTPLVFPGLFPFDVNLILAAGSALLFASCLLLELKYLFIPRTFMLAVVCVLGIQTFLAVSGNMLAPQGWGLQTINYIVAATMLIIGVSTTAASLRTWMCLYMSVAAIWSAAGLVVWLGGTSGLPLGIGSVAFTMGPTVKLAGPFNQGNIFAAAIGFAWIFSHWLFIVDKKRIYAFAIVFFTAMFFDSLSRGGWLAYTFAIILLLFALKPKTSFYMRQLLPIWAIGLTAGLVCSIFSRPLLEPEILLTTISSTSTSLHERLIFWLCAVYEFLRSPWTGVGWGQFAAEFWTANPQAQMWLQQHLGWDHSPHANALSAHNLILHALAEGGAITALLVVWGVWTILLNAILRARKSHGARLPFAMASLGFILQSQINVVFTHSLPLLMAAFFTGIALAPWLRKKSWRFVLQSSLRGAAWAISLLASIWAGQLSFQWFSAEHAIRSLDMNNKASVDRLVQFTVLPRIGTVSLVWLGYTVAREKKHYALLVWMLPYLQKSVHEIPSVSSYQILFYALVTAKKYEEACQLGKTISLQRFPSEGNDMAYKEVCEHKVLSRYKIGH